MLSCMSLPSSLGSTELSNTGTTSSSSPHIKPNNCSNISRSDTLVSCTQLGRLTHSEKRTDHLIIRDKSQDILILIFLYHSYTNIRISISLYCMTGEDWYTCAGLPHMSNSLTNFVLHVKKSAFSF